MVKFSILVVCLNPGEKLLKTVESILGQTCGDYEIIVKDGGSADGSIEKLPEDARIRVFERILYEQKTCKKKFRANRRGCRYPEFD